MRVRGSAGSERTDAVAGCVSAVIAGRAVGNGVLFRRLQSVRRITVIADTETSANIRRASAGSRSRFRMGIINVSLAKSERPVPP